MVVRNAASMGTVGSSWQAHGYAGNGNVHELIDSLKGRVAIICGNGQDVFKNLELAQWLLQRRAEHSGWTIDPPIIFAVNDVGMFLPKVDHWISLHAENLGTWKTVRWMHARQFEDTKYHSIDAKPYLNYAWDQLTPCFALSGYFAMQVAYIMGAELIVLAGCPGNATRRFFDLAPNPNFGYGGLQTSADVGIREQVVREMERLPEFRGKVRSMGGWTSQFFGRL